MGCQSEEVADVQRGLGFITAKTGEYVSGTLVASAQLASGRFAMIDGGIGFQLVPWGHSGFPGDPEAYCRKVLASIERGEITSQDFELPDGRCIKVVIVGGGALDLVNRKVAV